MHAHIAFNKYWKTLFPGPGLQNGFLTSGVIVLPTQLPRPILRSGLEFLVVKFIMIKYRILKVLRVHLSMGFYEDYIPRPIDA